LGCRRATSHFVVQDSPHKLPFHKNRAIEIVLVQALRMILDAQMVASFHVFKMSKHKRSCNLKQ
jgi:hypothetical protein